jgi:hypothetical protein
MSVYLYCLYGSVLSLTLHPFAGCGSNYAPWAAYVSGRERYAACQAAQRHHYAHLPYLGHDACQVFAQRHRRSGCCPSDTRATHPAYARALLQIIQAPLSARLRRKFTVCLPFPPLALTESDYPTGYPGAHRQDTVDGGTD